MLVYPLLLALIAVLALRVFLLGEVALTRRLVVRGSAARWIAVLCVAGVAVTRFSVTLTAVAFLVAILIGLVSYWRQPVVPQGPQQDTTHRDILLESRNDAFEMSSREKN